VPSCGALVPAMHLDLLFSFFSFLEYLGLGSDPSSGDRDGVG
jgi:hypothetical protein